MAKDKYLERLKEVKTKKSISEWPSQKERDRDERVTQRGINEGYKESKEKKHEEGIEEIYNCARRTLYDVEDEEQEDDLENSELPELRGMANSYASELLKYGAKQGNPEYAIKGAKLYDALGKGNSPPVKNKLIKSVKNAEGSGYKEVRDWIKQHPESNESKSLENLTKNIETVIGTLGIIGALFFLSPNVTGNAIGTLSTSATGFLGALCFVGGLTLLVLGTKK